MSKSPHKMTKKVMKYLNFEMLKNQLQRQFPAYILKFTSSTPACKRTTSSTPQFHPKHTTKLTTSLAKQPSTHKNKLARSLSLHFDIRCNLQSLCWLGSKFIKIPFSVLPLCFPFFIPPSHLPPLSVHPHKNPQK